MAQHSETQTREALSFATELRIWARENAPNEHLEHRLQKLATAIQLEFGESARLKRAKIVKFMQSDLSGETVSQRDVREYFGWTRNDVSQLFADLASEGRVEIVKLQLIDGQRGGRPATRYRLSGL